MTHARDFSVEDTLRDGTRVTIRAVKPDDEERIANAFRHLDQQSVYTRFFGYKRELSPGELARVRTMDFVREVMLIVTTRIGSEDVAIGSARYVADDAPPGERSAEIAFVVEEDFHGLGIARRLLAHLIAVARTHGIVRFEADVLPNNKAMLAVFARTGLPIQQHRDSDAIHITLDLVQSPE